MGLESEALRLMAESILTGTCTLANGRIVHLRDSDVLRCIVVIVTKKLELPLASAAATLVPHDLYLNGQIPLDAASGIDFDALERQINRSSEDQS